MVMQKQFLGRRWPNMPKWRTAFNKTVHWNLSKKKLLYILDKLHQSIQWVVWFSPATIPCYASLVKISKIENKVSMEKIFVLLTPYFLPKGNILLPTTPNMRWSLSIVIFCNTLKSTKFIVVYDTFFRKKGVSIFSHKNRGSFSDKEMVLYDIANHFLAEIAESPLQTWWTPRKHMLSIPDVLSSHSMGCIASDYLPR